MILPDEIEQYEDGTTIYWYSYQRLREHIVQQEINKIMTERSKGSNAPSDNATYNSSIERKRKGL